MPESALSETCAFYRDFGLAGDRAAAASRLPTAASSSRFTAAPRRTLLALTVGVDDADDLGRAAAALAKLGVASERAARRCTRASP